MEPGSDQWFVNVQGVERGPLSGRQIKALADGGKISPHTLLRRGDRTDWIRADRLKGLFAAAAPSSDSAAGVLAADRTVSVRPPARRAGGGRNDLLQHVVQGGRVAAPVATLFGFAGDVLNPLAPLNGILFLGSAAMFGFLGYRCHAQRQRESLDFARSFPEQAFIFSSFLMLVFGLWFGLQMASGSGDRGVIAAHIPAIASLQEDLLDVKRQVAEVATNTKAVKDETAAIKQDTAAISDNTRVIKQETGSIKEDTAAIKEGMEQLSEKIEKAGDGSLIQTPTTPVDFYHNARLQELSGRFGEAFESYKRYVGMNEEFVDPCLSYVKLLKTQRGHRAAEAEFAVLARQFPENRAIALAVASFAAGSDKRQALKALAERHPDFGPAYWLAAKEYSTEVLGTQSAIAVEHERDLLKSLVTRGESGDFSRYFLDKKQADEHVQQAVRRLNEMSTKQAGVRMRLGERDDPWPANTWLPLDSTIRVSIFDAHVKAVRFRLADEAWTEVPADQILPVDDRLTEIVWTWQMLPPPHTDKIPVDGDTQGVVWFTYSDAYGMESPPVPVFRLRRIAPRWFAARPEAEVPVRASP
jgi:hypothetical protein